MIQRSSTPRLVRFVLGAALGAALTLSTTAQIARAADDPELEEEVPADVRFFRNILAGLGLQRDGTGIDYRERSPLVVPPNTTLPKPELDNVSRINPAWPKDPDIQRVKQLRAERKKARKTIEEESTPEMPNQLNRPGAAINTATQRPTGDTSDPTRPSSNAELNTKSIFNLDALFGRNKEEYSTFVSEPPRADLIEPPPGYRTPSPSQPYGVGKQRWVPQAINPMDSPAMRGREN